MAAPPTAVFALTFGLLLLLPPSLGCSPLPRNSALYWDAATTTAPAIEPAAEDAATAPPPDAERGDTGIGAPDIRDAGASEQTDAAPRPDAIVDGRIPAAMCVLKVTVTTRTLNRSYAPRNVGAIWIADQTGKFVKSLNVWGNRRLAELDRWVAATRAAAVPNNRVDAVTAATMANHGTRTGTWNCTDVNRAAVPDGSYQVCFEMNETNNASEYECVAFNKLAAPQTVAPPDAPAFRARMIEYSP